MKGLMLHCGAEEITRENLKNLPIPNATETHFPVEHHRFVDLTERALNSYGFKIAEESYGVTKNGDRFFGLMKLQDENNPEFQNVVGLRGAHDKKFARELVMGSNVFVCDNLCFSGEIKVARKHTKKINSHLPGLVFEACEKLELGFAKQNERIKTYKNFDLSSNLQVNDLTVRMAENGAITFQQIKNVLNEYRNPRHVEFNDKNGWSYMNAITETSKGIPLDTLCKRTQIMHEILDVECKVENN